MALAPHSRLGPYEILAAIGEGGMGEVYRARDTRLERTVAIKVLSGRTATTHSAQLRFEREARAISTLNHPNVCGVHDIGSHNGFVYMVMEYLEGETLSERIRRGPLALEESIRYAKEIAGALAVAHRQGITHRDLKPANIMITKSGAKLLDFGLAKVQAAAAVAEGGVTQTVAVTTEGTLIGTIPYMAPEQLEGREADARSDIFSLGAVLYEMLTRRRAFEGATQASLITAIMSSTPASVSTIQPHVPAALSRIIDRCLEKDLDTRWQSALDLRHELEWVAQAPGPAEPARAVASRKHLGLFAAGALLLAAAAVIAILWLRPSQPAQARAAFEVAPPAGAYFRPFDFPVVSPDGSRIVFAAHRRAQRSGFLWVRAIGSTQLTPLTGTDVAYSPFWSPDGKQIGFFTDAALKRIDQTGRVFTVASLISAGGGSWGAGDVLLVGTSGSREGILQLPATGGELKPATKFAERDRNHFQPHFLPDGKRFLFFVESDDPQRQGVHLAELGSSESKRILDVRSDATVSSGHLLYRNGSELRAQRFDVASASVTGEPRTVASNLLPAFAFSTAATAGGSTMALRTGAPTIGTKLVWFDRGGRVLASVGDSADYSTPALSPDGRKVAICIADERSKRDVWIYDLVRGSRSRLTSHADDDLNPAWSPDGDWVYFTSDRRGGGHRDIYRKRADGDGPDELIHSASGRSYVEGVTADGRFVVFNRQPLQGGSADIMALPLSGDRQPVPVVATNFEEGHSAVSPNGRWIAYRSMESGQSEVYVKSFPSGQGKWHVSASGGWEPRWKADGKELYYATYDKIYAVPVNTQGQSFESGVPIPLFDAQLSNVRRNRFVSAPDGSRFLAVVLTDEAANAPFTVVLNWLDAK